jgi:dienelactone hydrolase
MHAKQAKNMIQKLFAALFFVLIHGGVFAVQPSDFTQKYVITMLPQAAPQEASQATKYPVLFFLQGSDGKNAQALDWASWAAQFGVASVLIDSARVRGMKNLFDVDYGSDVAAALDVVSSNPQLDLTRFAVMGFSRGGTAALESAAYHKPTQPKPDFIFALYQGESGQCSSKYTEPTKVLVFYGDQDDWGDYRGTRTACSKLPLVSSNASFHLLKNAHHGYDGYWGGKWQCCGNRTFTSEPNAEALETTRTVITQEIRKKWKLPVSGALKTGSTGN